MDKQPLQLATLPMVFVIILLAGLVAIIGFDHGEIQPWDEGLYALRARSILHHPEAWWDQTPYAVGASYSAHTPPLTVWAMAIAMYFVGENPLAVRLFSIFCHIIALIAVFLIARRLLPASIALLAPLLLASTMIWNLYARQGMTDIPVMTFSLLTLALLLEIHHRQTIHRPYQYLLPLVAMTTAAAVLTKYAISLLPLAFTFWIARSLSRWQDRWAIAAPVLVGYGIGAIWYGAMILKHPDTFTAMLALPHLSSVVENNARSWWYYFNQLLIANPLIITALPAIAMIIRRWKHRSTLEQILVLWSGGMLLLLSLAPTKMPHYTLFIIPPLLLLSLYGFHLLNHTRFLLPRVLWALLGCLLLTLWWAMDPSLRIAVRSLNIDTVPSLWIALLVWLFLSTLLFPTDVLQTLSARIGRPVIIFTLTLLLLRIVAFNSTTYQTLHNGAAVTAQVLTHLPPNKIGYLYHHHNRADRWNPQLMWYLSQHESHNSFDQYHRFPLDRYHRVRILAQIAMIPDSLFLVYYALDNSEPITRTVIRTLEGQRKLLLKTKNYFVFSPRNVVSQFQLSRWQIGL